MNVFQSSRSIDLSDNERLVENLISASDETFMSLPDFESTPHLLISKVRKHYMEYIIKLLSNNYENNQKLLNKNIYLPSAIWRCAKIIEMDAARTCMVVSLYQQNIVRVIKELKNDTEKGKLYKKLYECLHKPPDNEKKMQTSLPDDCNCECRCGKSKKRRKLTDTPKIHKREDRSLIDLTTETENHVYSIPVIANMLADTPQIKQDENQKYKYEGTQPTPENSTLNQVPSKLDTRMSIESHDSDELMLQLEKLFQSDSQEDDLFDGGLYDNFDNILNDSAPKTKPNAETIPTQDLAIESQEGQKSLDERIKSLGGLLVHNDDSNKQGKQENPKNNKRNTSKWLCEEYFLKTRYFELMDQIGDCSRKRLSKVKEVMTELFGEDSDDECIMSPLEETPEFIISCKERIAPWVVKLLTPYYIKGRIRGKSLFKSLAKHLIRLIYQCSKYPQEYEVCSFVTDFLENHKMIRCEADFKQFRIENLNI